jgi:hypothetical protein
MGPSSPPPPPVVIEAPAAMPAVTTEEPDRLSRVAAATDALAAHIWAPGFNPLDPRDTTRDALYRAVVEAQRDWREHYDFGRREAPLDRDAWVAEIRRLDEIVRGFQRTSNVLKEDWLRYLYALGRLFDEEDALEELVMEFFRAIKWKGARRLALDLAEIPEDFFERYLQKVYERPHEELESRQLARIGRRFRAQAGRKPKRGRRSGRLQGELEFPREDGEIEPEEDS